MAIWLALSRQLQLGSSLLMACIKCGDLLPTRRFDLQSRRMPPLMNASLHHPPFYARRKPPARSAVVRLEEARSSSLSWEARAKAQRIVTSSSSVRVGAAVPPKTGCLRYWKACGRVSQLRCMSLKKPRGLGATRAVHARVADCVQVIALILCQKIGRQ